MALGMGMDSYGEWSFHIWVWVWLFQVIPYNGIGYGNGFIWRVVIPYIGMGVVIPHRVWEWIHMGVVIPYMYMGVVIPYNGIGMGVVIPYG